MVLLKPFVFTQSIPEDFIFTFQYGATKTNTPPLCPPIKGEFTFQYGATKT